MMEQHQNPVNLVKIGKYILIYAAKRENKGARFNSSSRLPKERKERQIRINLNILSIYFFHTHVYFPYI